MKKRKNIIGEAYDNLPYAKRKEANSILKEKRMLLNFKNRLKFAELESIKFGDILTLCEILQETLPKDSLLYHISNFEEPNNYGYKKKR